MKLLPEEADYSQEETTINRNSTITADNERIDLDSSHTVIGQEEKKRGKKQPGLFKSVIRLMFNWTTISLLLAHHPSCETFDSHVFKIGKVRLCKGCALSYPPAYGIPIVFIAWIRARNFIIFSNFYIQNIWWFVIGTGILAIGTHLLKPYSKFINDFAKFTRGVWAGFLILSILVISPWYYKLIPLAITAVGLMLITLKRQKDMTKTCNECEWQSDYENCPGWKDFSLNFQSALNQPRNETVNTNNAKNDERTMESSKELTLEQKQDN